MTTTDPAPNPERLDQAALFLRSRAQHTRQAAHHADDPRAHRDEMLRADALNNLAYHVALAAQATRAAHTPEAAR